MEPSREVFWNIPLGVIVDVLAIIVASILVWALWRRARLWRLGGPENRLSYLGRRLRAFLGSLVVDILLHRKFLGVAEGLGHRRLAIKDLRPREFYPGLIHFLIFSGVLVLFLGTVLVSASHYFFHFLEGSFYLGFSLALDIAGLVVIVGVVLAVHRRYIQRPARLDNKGDDLITLLLLLALVVSGFLVEGLRIAATELKTNPGWALWSPVGYLLALGFSGLSQAGLLIWHRVTWWLHMLLSMGALVYVALYWNRLWHIVVATLNIFFRNLESRGALRPIDLEQTETFGAAKIEDFSWKHLLDLDACTRCGRCQDSCPAYLSGKPLSPKKTVQDLKASLLARTADSGDGGRELIGEVVQEDEIWNCTTCYACQEVCPVYIEPMVKLLEMRRNLVLERASIPETGEGALKSLEARGHPWRGTTLSRTDWAQGLDIKTLADDSDIDILFWVGCTQALEERSTRVAQAIARILKLAGVNFGILGVEEVCCGDPARRLGNEYLFQLQVQGNIELLKNYGIRKIVTGCPHCYNTLKHEYPQFGAGFQVIHHTEFIASLLKEGRLGILKGSGGVITYHDSCYLGRYNDIYELPRQILNHIPGIRLVEMAQNRERGFCCGAGGGHLWLEEQKVGQRINEMRTEQALATRAEVIATACPYCLQMFEDGIKSKEAEERLKVMDIAELVIQAVS